MKTQATLTTLLLICAPGLADVTSDVRCREIGFSQSVEEQDLTAFESFLDIDARFVGASINRGPAEIVEAWSVFFSEDGPRITWRPQIVEVLEDGKLALSRGPYKMTSRDADGKQIESWGTFNSIWRKQSDDTWKVVFDAGNASPTPPSDDVQALFDKEPNCP